ncbi:MAG: hypothetical protein AAFX80_14885 [Cyanobacteria bacterium J06639_18]
MLEKNVYIRTIIKLIVSKSQESGVRSQNRPRLDRRAEVRSQNSEIRTQKLRVINYLLVITYYPLPITNYQLPITNYQLPITK